MSRTNKLMKVAPLGTTFRITVRKSIVPDDYIEMTYNNGTLYTLWIDFEERKSNATPQAKRKYNSMMSKNVRRGFGHD